MVSNFKEFIKKRGIAGIIGGIWAEIPDFEYLWGGSTFHNTWVGELFFFHQTMDSVVPETDLFFAAEMMLLFFAINLFAIAASVESFKRLREALFGKEEEEEVEEKEEGEDEREEERDKIEKEPDEQQGPKGNILGEKGEDRAQGEKK